MTDRITLRDHLFAWGLLGLWVAFAVWRDAGQWSIDLSALFMAGHVVATGAPELIYGTASDWFGGPPPEAWVAALADMGETAHRPTFYIYPPIWAHLTAPLADALSPRAFFDLGRLAVTLSMAVTVMVLHRLMAARVAPAVFAAAAILLIETSMPTITAIGFAQPQVLVIGLIALSVQRFAAGGRIGAGVLLGLAAGIKITPILLILMFLGERDWRAPLAALVTAGAMAALSLAVAGWEVHALFLARAAEVDALVPLVGLNLTFETVVHDLGLPLTPCLACLAPQHGLNTPFVGWLSFCLMLTAMLAALFATRGLPRRTRLALRLLLLYLSVTFFGSLAWVHYYALPVLMLPGFAALLPRRVFLPLAALAWAPMSYPVLGALVTWREDLDPLFYADTQSIGLLSLLAFVALAAAVIRRRGAAATPVLPPSDARPQPL